MSADTALLVIDMQNGFLRGLSALVARVRSLSVAWPPASQYWLRYRNHPDSNFVRHLDWSSMMVGPEVALADGLVPPPGHLFEHYGYGPEADLLLLLGRYRQVAICGVDTDACVMAATFALWDHGVRPRVLADYCASSGGTALHEAALGLMLRQFGTAGVVLGPISGPSDLP